jgi:mono/diheme cytochrome c family protein
MFPVPHILKDGADSVGVPGATIRVYVNIGMFSEYWLTRHDRLLGLWPQKPFEIPYAREHSVFWLATEKRLANIAAFFRRLHSFRLADAPGGQTYITTDAVVMTRGKEVFAESCASCHSSKQPPANIDPRSGEGKRGSAQR